MMKAAITPSGFSEDGEDKRETRRLLLAAASKYLPHPPFTIFTFPGIEGHCTALFRQTWPQARIIGVDRQSPATRFTKAHWHGRETAIGTIENEIIHGTLHDYGARGNASLWRRMRSGSKHRLLTFDFPAFDLMFLDTTARFDSSMNDAINMIDHCASPAIVGVTMVLGSRKQREINGSDFAEDFRQQITRRKTTIIGEPMDYTTTSSMLFFILLVQ